MPLTYSFASLILTAVLCLLQGLSVSPWDRPRCTASSRSQDCFGPSGFSNLARCRRHHTRHPTRHSSVGSQQDLAWKELIKQFVYQCSCHVQHFFFLSYCFHYSAHIIVSVPASTPGIPAESVFSKHEHSPVSAVVTAAAPAVVFLSQTQQAAPGS